MATNGRTKAAKRLKAITREAKRIRRNHPRMTWQGALKKAGKSYK